MDAHGAGAKLRCAGKRVLTQLSRRVIGCGFVMKKAESTHLIIAMLHKFMTAGSGNIVQVNVTDAHAAARGGAARGSSTWVRTHEIHEQTVTRRVASRVAGSNVSSRMSMRLMQGSATDIATVVIKCGICNKQ